MADARKKLDVLRARRVSREYTSPERRELMRRWVTLFWRIQVGGRLGV